MPSYRLDSLFKPANAPEREGQIIRVPEMRGPYTVAYPRSTDLSKETESFIVFEARRFFTNQTSWLEWVLKL